MAVASTIRQVCRLGSDAFGCPWLDHIVSGQKRFEGRLNTGKLTTMAVGELIKFVDGTGNAQKKDQLTKIISNEVFDTFTEAHAKYGYTPIPIQSTSDGDKQQLPMGICSYRAVGENVSSPKVVVLGLELVGDQ